MDFGTIIDFGRRIWISPEKVKNLLVEIQEKIERLFSRVEKLEKISNFTNWKNRFEIGVKFSFQNKTFFEKKFLF